MSNTFRPAGIRFSCRRLSGEMFHVVVVENVVINPPKMYIGSLRNYRGWEALLYEIDFECDEWKQSIELCSRYHVESLHRIMDQKQGVIVAAGKLQVREFVFQQMRRQLVARVDVTGFTFLARAQRRGVKSNVMSAMRKISFEQEILRTCSVAGDGTRCPECSLSRCNETCPSFS